MGMTVRQISFCVEGFRCEQLVLRFFFETRTNVSQKRSKKKCSNFFFVVITKRQCFQLILNAANLVE